MERIQALIDKLYQQKNANVSPSQLLMTVELLRSELAAIQHQKTSLGTAKVAVMLPRNMNFNEPVVPETAAVLPEEVKIPVAPAPVREEKIEPQLKEYTIRKPLIPEEKKETVPSYKQQEFINPAFAIAEDAPLLAQQNAVKELHEVIAEKKESLNDKLKQDRKELVHSLKETPIKDLRKGIGINDRFTFINELFKGDEAMYERSIKTINSFNIFSEAEYWMNRELKLKLGWNEDHEGVQHFYHLVRRRFS